MCDFQDFEYFDFFEYGLVPAPISPDNQPASHCSIYSIFSRKDCEDDRTEQGISKARARSTKKHRNLGKPKQKHGTSLVPQPAIYIYIYIYIYIRNRDLVEIDNVSKLKS